MAKFISGTEYFKIYHRTTKIVKKNSANLISHVKTFTLNINDNLVLYNRLGYGSIFE